MEADRFPVITEPKVTGPRWRGHGSDQEIKSWGEVRRDPPGALVPRCAALSPSPATPQDGIDRAEVQ